MKHCCGLVGKPSPLSATRCPTSASVFRVMPTCCGFISALLTWTHCSSPKSHWRFACPPAVSQVMSMRRTTCCLPLRSSRATPPERRNLSGSCSSAARSCARWEWHIAVVMPLYHVAPEEWFMLPGTGDGGFITYLQSVCVCVCGSVPSPGSQSNLLSKTVSSDCPQPGLVFICHLCRFTHL